MLREVYRKSFNDTNGGATGIPYFGPVTGNPNAPSADRRSAELAKARAAVEGHPLVQEAVRLFGAQLRDVKLPSGET